MILLCYASTHSLQPRNFSRTLRRVLGQRGQVLPVAFGLGNHFHLLPVIGKLAAAIQASNVSSRQTRGLGPSCSSTNGHGKAVTRMPATKERIHQFTNHIPTFHSRAGWLDLRTKACALHVQSSAHRNISILDSGMDLTVSSFRGEMSQKGKTPRTPYNGYSYSGRKNLSRGLHAVCGPRFFCCWHFVMMADRNRPRRSSGSS